VIETWPRVPVCPDLQGDLQFLCALRMYLSDPILHHLTEMEAATPSGIVHPRLWEDLYKMSSNLSCMRRGEFRYDRYTVLLQTAYMQALAQPNRT
jgi:hypothetical protein